MKIIVTRSTFIGGKLIEASDMPIDVSEADAKQLLLLEKAVKAPEPVVSTETAESTDVPAPSASSANDKPKKK